MKRMQCAGLSLLPFNQSESLLAHTVGPLRLLKQQVNAIADCPSKRKEDYGSDPYIFRTEEGSEGA